MKLLMQTKFEQIWLRQEFLSNLRKRTSCEPELTHEKKRTSTVTKVLLINTSVGLHDLRFTMLNGPHAFDFATKSNGEKKVPVGTGHDKTDKCQEESVS